MLLFTSVIDLRPRLGRACDKNKRKKGPNTCQVNGFMSFSLSFSTLTFAIRRILRKVLPSGEYISILKMFVPEK
jgi:hypothetical protein